MAVLWTDQFDIEAHSNDLKSSVVFALRVFLSPLH